MLLLPRALHGAGAALALTSLCTCLLLAGCAQQAPAPGDRQRTESKSAEGRPSERGPARGEPGYGWSERGPRAANGAGAHGVAGGPVEASLTREIPGLGPVTRASIPVSARQALVVTGEGRNSPRSGVALYQRDADTGWQPVTNRWPAHNALRGWTRDHRASDLRSPIGVFTLGDAGGRLPDPGSRLPYDEDSDFAASGTGFLGEPLEGSFDYVVAIDYNRTPGTTPLDKERPLGEGKGGGVWIHVDHKGPTQACVSLSRTHMVELLRLLDPAKRPVIVMGDALALRD
ncbi:hypothetical protein [Streptomyces sp. NPDC058595]|uniref:hypothetical protein n=1 Tax=Streptomyces sp. NPDC058595 TaxID=3346550 RepID=UPI00364641D2